MRGDFHVDRCVAFELERLHISRDEVIGRNHRLAKVEKVVGVVGNLNACVNWIRIEIHGNEQGFAFG